MYTYDDFLADTDKVGFIERLINQHKASALVKIALDADEYDGHRNTGIRRFYDAYCRANGATSKETAPMASNFYHRLNTQRCTYSLGNGVSFAEEGVKDKLGSDFDTALNKVAYNSLIHGLSFGFWNMDKMVVFPVTEFAPLWDEQTGSLRAGVRYWRLQPDKPLFAVLYEEDGYTEFKSKTKGGSDLAVLNPKRAYKQIVRTIPAEGQIVIGEDNYGSLPIVPLWGNRNHQSTLVGMKGAIDNYDIIFSGFADTVHESAEIYWIISNYGGMNQKDANEYLQRLRMHHIANADNSGGGAVTPYTQAIPTEARTALLDKLHSQIYEDFGGLDVHSVSASSTNDHLEAAYQPMDENADDFEYQIIQFVQQIEKVAGIEDAVPLFKRNRISNQTEQIENVIKEAPYLDSETILNKLPNITPDEVKNILKNRDAENASRFTSQTDDDEDNLEEAEGDA